MVSGDPVPSERLIGETMNALPQRADIDGETSQPRGRGVIAKPGLDRRGRDDKVVATRALRGAGHEMGRTGPRQTPEQIAATVDVLGTDRTDVRETAC
jgi:methylmalonyl-CoA mutase cobalamin-binding subunit